MSVWYNCCAFYWFLSGSAFIPLYPVWIPSSTFLPPLFPSSDLFLNLSRQSKPFELSFLLYPLRNLSYIFSVVHHYFVWPGYCLSQYLSPSLSPPRADHHHVPNVLGRISTLAFWAYYIREFSSVQIRVKPDMLASYLYGNTALGPVQVSMDFRRCSSIVHSLSICLLVNKQVCCFPDFGISRCLVTRVPISFLALPGVHPLLKCGNLSGLFLSTLGVVILTNSCPFGPIFLPISSMQIFLPSTGQS